MKNIIAAVCTVFVLTIFGGNAFSQETETARIEQHLQNSGQMSAKDIIRSYQADSGMNRRSSGSFSTNKTDLMPLAGTTWEFTYTIQTAHTDKVTFVPYIEYADDGDAELVCVSDLLASGLTVFKLSDGNFFAMLMGLDMIQIFDFTVSGDRAEGSVIFSFDGGYEWAEFSMTGKRTFSASSAESASCISAGDDLTIPVCVEYAGTEYGFDLNFHQNPADPFGLYWKMDMTTLTVE
ncbi:MAG: hypothetical protein AB7S75_10705 [Desulfococcaceae bacterium]